MFISIKLISKSSQIVCFSNFPPYLHMSVESVIFLIVLMNSHPSAVSYSKYAPNSQSLIQKFREEQDYVSLFIILALLGWLTKCIAQKRCSFVDLTNSPTYSQQKIFPSNLQERHGWRTPHILRGKRKDPRLIRRTYVFLAFSHSYFENKAPISRPFQIPLHISLLTAYPIHRVLGSWVDKYIQREVGSMYFLLATRRRVKF